ncbi:MAG TPA: XkdX family protein [Pseudoflavonifractor sp.]|nr:XkdX family protein [Pseudoflavonifractor sp.]
MNIFDMAKKNYYRGLWTMEMLAALVVKGKLGAAEYQTITGQAYEG